MDIDKRNAAIIKLLQRQTEERINNPEKLAAWVAEQRAWMEEYDAYMEQEFHEGNCHCARCMSEFVSRVSP